MNGALVPAWAVAFMICLFVGVVGAPATADAHVGHPSVEETTMAADPISSDAAEESETSQPTCAGDCCTVGAHCFPAVAMAATSVLAPHLPARATGGVEKLLANLASRESLRRPPKPLL